MAANLAGKHYVITGRLDNFKSRAELEVLVRAAGGFIDKKITAITDALITNTPDSGTKKNRDAQALGVEVITENEFYDRTGILD